ncbi:MAG: amidohydrolase [Bacteroidetes bacterium]|nr:MAG: amidohydrolase [Bacteroidota bacterium]
MNRLLVSFLTVIILVEAEPCHSQNPEEIKLKDFRPKSIFRVPATTITKAKFPAIDMHSHDFAKTDKEVAQWVKTMDQAGIEKTIILSGAVGTGFDSIYSRYAKYGDRFEVWCGFDIDGFKEPGWTEKAVKELERCVKAGARGVGELSDKGFGLRYSAGFGPHIDDPLMRPLLKRCGELNIPINIHVAEPIWMYLPMDSTNDGLMNAYTWRIDSTQKGIFGHAALIKTLDNAVRDNPHTTFIACHYANCEYDLSILGSLLDKYKNLYADASARFGETSTIPRYMATFYKKYQDKLLYGTDNIPESDMYEITFRILESLDEHFYYYRFYHWPSYGFGLNDDVLKKVYHENATKILKHETPKR